MGLSTKPTASPSLRARNLRMRDWSASSNGGGLSNSSHHQTSTSSLGSINSARHTGADNSNHFRFAGRSIMGNDPMQAVTQRVQSSHSKA